MLSYADIEDETLLLVKGVEPGVLDGFDYQRAIYDAIQVFSQDVPLRKVEVYPSLSGGMYDLPPSFEIYKDCIYEVESPIGKTPKCVIPSQDYTLDDTPTGVKLRFKRNNPIGIFWVKYTSSYALDSGSSNIEDRWLKPISWLAAYYLLEVLATHYAGKTDPNIDAGIVDFAGRVSEWSERASKYKSLYYSHIKNLLLSKSVYKNITNLDRDDFFYRGGGYG